jgi:glycine cleavage system H protein
VRRTGDDTVRVGITDFAQQQLGDVVFVQLPDSGEQLKSGTTLGEIESTKSVSDVYAPLDAEVIAANDGLSDSPELINSDPYGDGWLLELRVPDPAAVDALLDAAAYRELAENDR